ncbi:MAG: hypothetical protein ABIJ40_12330 [Bacteroidota bacterium]
MKHSCFTKLSDYGVEVPSMAVGKVDNNIKVTATFITSDLGK